MAETKTTQKIIQEKIYELLNSTEGQAELTVNGRAPLIKTYVPDVKYSQANLPLIAINRPIELERQSWDYFYDRVSYGVPLLFVDAGGSPQQQEASREALELLKQKVRKYLRSIGNLELAYLHVYQNQMRWTDGDDTNFIGQNLIEMPVSIEIFTLQSVDMLWYV